MVEPGQAATTGTNLDEINGWHRYGETRTLLEPVHTGHLEGVGERRFAVDDETRLGGGASHVEAQQAILAKATRKPTTRKCPGRRSGLH